MEYTRFRTDSTRSSRSAAFAWLCCHFNLSSHTSDSQECNALQRQQRPYNLQLQSPLNSQGAQVGNREFTLGTIRIRSFPLISDAMPSLLHLHTLFFIHNMIPFTDSQNRVTVAISTPLYSIPLSTT